MRTKKSMLNVMTALSGQGISLLANLLSRMIFTRYMSQNYLGLMGLFGNILTVLSLVELGVGPAITFALYKPLRDQDTELIKSLMKMFQKAYRTIGVLILILGFAFTPFYPFFIKDTSGVENLTIIYWLYILNTGISYFYSYKISLLTADQNQYIRNIGHYTSLALMNIAQLVILILTQNYLLFLTCQIVFTFLENLILSQITDKRYPYLKSKQIQPLSKEVTEPIWRNIKAMMFHKVGGIVVNSTDNLLISKFLGLAVTGIYSNYALVVSAVQGVLSRVFEAVVASVGNLNAEGNQEKMNDTYDRLYFLSFWLFSFCGICLACLLQPFIKTVFGEKYLLDNLTVAMLSLCFYTYGMRQAPNVIRSAAGLYYKDWFKPLIEAGVNLISSIIFLKWFGVAGIFMGTIASTVLVNAWIEALIVYRYALHRSFLGFLIQYVKYFLMFLCGGMITSFACGFVKVDSFVGVVVKLIVCICITNGFFVAITHKRKEFSFFLQFVKKICKQLMARSV